MSRVKIGTSRQDEMRIVVQRVRWARVSVEGRVVSEIGPGLLLLVGIGRGDGPEEVAWLARKIPHLRLFAGESGEGQGQGRGKLDRSLLEIGGEVLAVPQFTLYGDVRKGRRPSFDGAAPPGEAEPLFERFVEELKGSGLRVEQGIFRAHMVVELANDGPVTLILER